MPAFLATVLGGIYEFWAALGLAIGQFNFLNAATAGHVWWKPLMEWFAVIVICVLIQHGVRYGWPLWV